MKQITTLYTVFAAERNERKYSSVDEWNCCEMEKKTPRNLILQARDNT